MVETWADLCPSFLDGAFTASYCLNVLLEPLVWPIRPQGRWANDREHRAVSAQRYGTP